jgi:hypothetical protein
MLVKGHLRYTTPWENVIRSPSWTPYGLCHITQKPYAVSHSRLGSFSIGLCPWNFIWENPIENVLCHHALFLHHAPMTGQNKCVLAHKFCAQLSNKISRGQLYAERPQPAMGDIIGFLCYNVTRCGEPMQVPTHTVEKVVAAPTFEDL